MVENKHLGYGISTLHRNWLGCSSHQSAMQKVCIYDGNNSMLMLVYVDDMLLITTSKSLLYKVKR
jgi:hypothetical protein